MDKPQRSGSPTSPDDLPSNLDVPDPPSAIVCPICYQVYDEPKLLNCGHTFCLKCIRELARLAEVEPRDMIFTVPKFACPECRTMIPVSASETLRTNYRLADVIQQFNAMKTGPGTSSSSREKTVVKEPSESLLKCNNCNENVKRKNIFICLSCLSLNSHEKYLCGTCCVNLHNGHHLTPVDQITNAQERQQFTSEIMGKIRQIKTAFDEHMLESKNSKEELTNMIKLCMEHSINASSIEKLPGNNRTTKEDLAKFQVFFTNLTSAFANVLAQLRGLDYDYNEQLHALMNSFENEYKGQVTAHFPSATVPLSFMSNIPREPDNVFLYNSSPRNRTRRPRRVLQRAAMERQERNNIPADDEDL